MKNIRTRRIWSILCALYLCCPVFDAHASNTWTYTRKANLIISENAISDTSPGAASYIKSIDRAAALRGEALTSRTVQSELAATPPPETSGGRPVSRNGTTNAGKDTPNITPVPTVAATPVPTVAVETPKPTTNIPVPATATPVVTATPIPTPVPTVAPTPVPTVAPTPTPEPVKEKPVLSDADYAFLVSNADVNWNDNNACVQWARANTAGMTDQQIFNVVFQHLAGGYTYDMAVYEAQSLPAGYKPTPDTTFATKKGICYDLSALMAAMLRSCGVPCKLVKGSSDLVGGYHAWNQVLLGGSWKTVDMTVVVVYRDGGAKYPTYMEPSQYQAKSYH